MVRLWGLSALPCAAMRRYFEHNVQFVGFFLLGIHTPLFGYLIIDHSNNVLFECKPSDVHICTYTIFWWPDQIIIMLFPRCELRNDRVSLKFLGNVVTTQIHNRSLLSYRRYREAKTIKCSSLDGRRCMNTFRTHHLPFIRQNRFEFKQGQVLRTSFVSQLRRVLSVDLVFDVWRYGVTFFCKECTLIQTFHI